MKGRKLKSPENFINRELSWLEFNQRVLDEARDESNPLLERVKFLAISASNLDEFFMVRVARLQLRLDKKDERKDPAGMSPKEQLQAVRERARRMMEQQQEILRDELAPALAGQGIGIVPIDELEGEEIRALERRFREDLLPVLTPLAIDPSHPFPMLVNLSMYLAVRMGPHEEEKRPELGVVQIPPGLDRLVPVPGRDGCVYVLLEDLIRRGLSDLFRGREILESPLIRVARDSQLDFDDEGGRDLLQVVRQELRRRRRNRAVRLEVEPSAGEDLVETLVGNVGCKPKDVFRIGGMMELRSLFALAGLRGRDALRDEAFPPQPVPEVRGRPLFEVMEERDVLLHHPYDSFDPVVELMSRGADDPNTLALKITLYRTSGDSPIIAALERAADAGKQVTALLELTARFDEERNIGWARRLEEAGAHVIYGVRGLKTHSKTALVVRRTPAGLRRYVHLGTGNYNDGTARLYTDFGLLTTDEELGRDASAFFNTITGYSDPPTFRKLTMAPTGLRRRFLELLDRERQRAEEGEPCGITAKMNSLVDRRIILALYRASRAGVPIRLNIRGICCLRPGVPGLSESIHVRSIVDRFLEHSRIFHFVNGGEEEVYLASADWMTRNLDRRIELLFPVEDAACRAKLLSALEAFFRDNVKARALGPDGEFARVRAADGESAYRVQTRLYEEAARDARRAEEERRGEIRPAQSRREGARSA
jgi:polyphosphate kinase